MSIRDGIMEYVRRGFGSYDGAQSQRMREFIVGQMSDSGGFIDRDGKDDLYYTVFGLQLVAAAGMDVPYERVSGFLQRYYDKIADFDLLEAASLGRCMGMLPMEYQFDAIKDMIAERIQAFTSADGSFALSEASESGSIYAAFIAVGALQDMGQTITNPRAVVSSIESLALADGSYVNEKKMPIGMVPSTAAAVVLLDILLGSVPAKACEWLMSCNCAEGGFSAVPGGNPDLLSTAVAMYALKSGCKCVGSELEGSFYDCGRFADAMKAENGGYYGSPEDKVLDSEYCYYGLLIKGICGGLG